LFLKIIPVQGKYYIEITMGRPEEKMNFLLAEAAKGKRSSWKPRQGP
jgi:hypothetical protein